MCGALDIADTPRTAVPVVPCSVGHQLRVDDQQLTSTSSPVLDTPLSEGSSSICAGCIASSARHVIARHTPQQQRAQHHSPSSPRWHHCQWPLCPGWWSWTARGQHVNVSTPHQAGYRHPACLDACLRGLRYGRSCLVVRCTVTTGTTARDLRTPWRMQEPTNRNQVRTIRTTHCGLRLNACAVCLRSVSVQLA